MQIRMVLSLNKYQYLQRADYDGSKITAEVQGLGFKWGLQYVPCLDAFIKDILCGNCYATMAEQFGY